MDEPPRMNLPQALASLTVILPKLAAVVDRASKQDRATVPLESRLAIRIDELAEALGVSRRALERERAAGRFPPPDLKIGKMPLWRIETIRNWLMRSPNS